VLKCSSLLVDGVEYLSMLIRLMLEPTGGWVKDMGAVSTLMGFVSEPYGRVTCSYPILSSSGIVWGMTISFGSGEDVGEGAV
jgi:hypothetical protein